MNESLIEIGQRVDCLFKKETLYSTNITSRVEELLSIVLEDQSEQSEELRNIIATLIADRYYYKRDSRFHLKVLFNEKKLTIALKKSLKKKLKELDEWFDYMTYPNMDDCCSMEIFFKEFKGGLV